MQTEPVDYVECELIIKQTGEEEEEEKEEEEEEEEDKVEHMYVPTEQAYRRLACLAS